MVLGFINILWYFGNMCSSVQMPLGVAPLYSNEVINMLTVFSSTLKPFIIPQKTSNDRKNKNK